MGVIRTLIERKTLSILDLLIKNKQKQFHLSEISSQSKIPLASTFRIVNRLVSLKIIDVTVIGKMKIYKFSENKEAKQLQQTIKNE